MVDCALPGKAACAVAGRDRCDVLDDCRSSGDTACTPPSMDMPVELCT